MYCSFYSMYNSARVIPPTPTHAEPILQPTGPTLGIPVQRFTLPFTVVLSQVMSQMHPKLKQQLITINETELTHLSNRLHYQLVSFSEPLPVFQVVTHVTSRIFVNSTPAPINPVLDVGSDSDQKQDTGITFTMKQGIVFNQSDYNSKIDPAFMKISSSIMQKAQNRLHVNQKIEVPPNSKLTVTVTAKVLQYEGEAIVDVGAPTDAMFQATREITRTPCCFSGGGTRRMSEAHDLDKIFRTQQGYRNEGTMVFYRSIFRYSYHGEQLTFHAAIED